MTHDFYEQRISEIDHIKFSLLSKELIDKNSVFKIDRYPNGIEIPESYENNDPKKGGLLDPLMGPVTNNVPCLTCGLDFKNCPGHFGHIRLYKPIFHISLLTKIQNILQCVCIHCGKLYLDTSDTSKKELTRILKSYEGLRRFDKIRKSKITTSVKHCVDNGCNNPKPKIKKNIKKEDKSKSLEIFAEYIKKDESKEVFKEKLRISAGDCYNIFTKISDGDCEILGFDPNIARPEDMIIISLPVPPVAIRPSIRSDNGIQEDHLTHKLSDIIKINNKIGKHLKLNANANMNYEKMQVMDIVLQYHVTTYIDNDVGGILPATDRSGKTLKTLTNRLKSKTGRIRNNLMGKRVNFSARSVITPDPNLSVDELGIPLKIAMNLTIPEIVTKDNIDKMKKLVSRGQDEYPGANFVIYGNKTLQYKKGISTDLRYGKNKIELKEGDIVERHLQDGDIVLFNRQPSLHKYSMMAHNAKIIPNPKLLTFRLNICTVSPYNADFDGDEMNMHIPQNKSTSIELKELAHVSKMIISGSSSKPNIGINMDPLVGSYIFTKQDIKISRTDVMNLLYRTNIDYSKINLNKETYTGQEIFSFIIPEEIDMINKSTGFHIENGKLLSGIVDKSIVGTKKGSLNHIIWNLLGPKKSVNFLNNVQRLINHWLLNKGFSVGMKDTVLQPDINDKIRNIINTNTKKIDMLITDIENRINDYGMDFLEKKTLDLLSDALNNSIKLAINSVADKNNNFISMYESGAKGSSVNIGQITACLGSQDQEGRLKKKYNGRVTPYYSYNDDTASARGFVSSSFLSGLEVPEYIYHAMTGRDGIIDTAVKTSGSGYIQRKLVKLLEDIMVCYDGTVRGANDNIIQFTYGEDGIEPTRLEVQQINLLKYSETQMKKIYKFDDNELKTAIKIKNDSSTNLYNIKKTPDFDKELNEDFYLKMLEYKKDLENHYRKIYYDDKILNTQYYLMPFNLYRLINTKMLRKYDKSNNNSDLHPCYILQVLNRLVEDPDLNITCMSKKDLKNKESMKNKIEMNSKFLIKILIYTYLAPRRCIFEYKLSKQEFNNTIEKIRFLYQKSIIQPGEMVGVMAAQSLGEPSTQMTLNTFHYAGVGSKGVGSLGIKRLVELLSLTENMKKPIMTVYLDDKYKQDLNKVNKIISYVKEIFLVDIINKNNIKIYLDSKLEIQRQDNVSLSHYVDENNRRKGKTHSKGLLPWVIRIELNREIMLNYGITLLDIKTKFHVYWKNKQIEITMKKEEKEVFDKITNVSIMTNYDNSEVPIIHIRLDLQPFDYKTLVNFQDIISRKLKIRGIENIGDVEEEKVKKIVFNEDDDKDYEYILYTKGSNLMEIRKIEGIDLNHTITNNIREIYNIFGIEATRNALINEFNSIFKEYSIDYHHIALLVDLMCNRIGDNNAPLPIDRNGLKKMDAHALAKASFEMPDEHFFNAAIFGEIDDLTCVSSRIMVGQHIKGGTGLCDLLLDFEMIEKSQALYDMKDQTIVEDLQPNQIILDILNKKNKEIFIPS